MAKYKGQFYLNNGARLNPLSDASDVFTADGSTVEDKLDQVGQDLDAMEDDIGEVVQAQRHITGGTSNFAGNGNEVTIPHGMGSIPTSAYVFPKTNPSGYLGEVWIRIDATNLYIGNSGSFTGQMYWAAVQ